MFVHSNNRVYCMSCFFSLKNDVDPSVTPVAWAAEITEKATLGKASAFCVLSSNNNVSLNLSN